MARHKKPKPTASEVPADLYKSFQIKAVERITVYHGYSPCMHVICQEWGIDAKGVPYNGWYVLRDKNTGAEIGIGPDAKILSDQYRHRTAETTTVKVYRNAHLLMTREWGPTPWGTVFNGQWVVRDIRDGSLINNSQYSNDLIDIYNFPVE